MGSKRVCRLCLNIIVRDNFETLGDMKKGMLAVIIPEFNLDLKCFPNIICQKCSNRLHASYEYKSFCMENNWSLTSLDDDEQSTETTDSAGELHLKQANAATKCCLCADDLQEICDGVDISLLNIKLEKCFPELIIPPCSTVCDNCRPMLEDLFTFVTGCLYAETKINDFPYLDVISDVEGRINLYKIYEFYSHGKSTLDYVNGDCVFVDTKGSSRGVEGCVKAETVTEGAKAKRIKTEPACEENNREFVFVKNEFECTVKDEKVDASHCGESESGDTEPSEDPSKIQHDHNETYPEDPRGIIGSNFSVKVEEALGEDSKNARTQEILYECKECGFRTKHKYSCRRHLITHRNIPGMQTSRCEFCPFTTRRRQTLTEHMALHADPAQVKAPESKTPSVSDDLEVTLYSCKDCPFKTKFKQNLSWHKLTHKYQQEGRPHSCTECNFQTKYERCLKAHMKRKHSS